MLERVLHKHMLHVWQSCARQLFGAADPVKFIAGGASGINADAPRGLDKKDVADRELLHKITWRSTVACWSVCCTSTCCMCGKVVPDSFSAPLTR